MVDNPLKKIFLAFLSELDKEIKELHLNIYSKFIDFLWLKFFLVLI